MMGVIVVIRREQDRGDFMRDMAAAGIVFAEYSHLDRFFLVEGVTVDTFPLANHPGCVSVEAADMQIKGAAAQNIVLDQYLQTSNWAITRVIRRRAPWPTNPGKFPQNAYFRCARDATGVDIYVIDSGLRTTHTEFGGRATNVYDATGTNTNWFHGTACGSMAAGATVGLARGANLFSFQCLSGADGTGTLAQATSAMNQALSHYQGRSGTNRPAIVNLSLEGFSSSISSAVSALIDAGMVTVIAAGNATADLGTTAAYPAESDADAIVVGGTTACDVPYYVTTSGSNYGARIDVSAPSQANYFAMNTGDSDYGSGDGTSWGNAYTSGAVACMLQGYSRLTSRAQVEAVRSFVMNGATTGKVRGTPQQPLPDRLLYLNPDVSKDTIPGL